MGKYYLIMGKPTDYNQQNVGVYFGKEKDIKKYVYHYKEIPKTHFYILEKYFENLNEFDDEDMTFGDYLEEYF